MKSDNRSALLRNFLCTNLLLLLVIICVPSLALSQKGVRTRIKPGGGAGQADLIVSKTGDETAPRGGQVSYNIVVSNDGPDIAGGVVLTDPFPAHTAYVSSSVSQGSVVVGANSITANFGSINPTESATLILTLSIDQDTPRGTTLSNTATVTADTPDPVSQNNSSTAFTAVTGAFGGDLVISEFRLRGPGTGVQDRGTGRHGLSNSATDEFIEIYNNTGQAHLVTSGGGTGYGIVASDGVLRCTIPNGTVIPRNGHFLCVNSNGYSLSGYPAGNFTSATGDASYALDIPDNAGIALFNNNNNDYSLVTRLDAVGSTSEANTLYKEGTGYPALTNTFAIDSSFYRDNCGRQGAVNSLQPCTITTGVIDTDNNANDFIFVDTNGTSEGAGQRLGAPGPENLSAPVEKNAQYGVTFLDPCVASSSAPNQVRDLTSDPGNNSTFGTIELRRTITNNGDAPATRLRFRVTQQTTFPAPSGTADLRIRSSSDLGVSVDRTPCDGQTSSITVHGTTLEQPPNQPNGGGFNSTVSAISPSQAARPASGKTISGTLDLSAPLNPGESIDLRFLYGIQQTGKFRVTLNVEVVEEAPQEGLPGGRKPTRR